MIPSLQDGVLPAGIHEGTVDEVVKIFGQFQRTDRRPYLIERLIRFIADAQQADFVTALIVDGSYVTAKDEPNDIDLLLVLRPDFDLKEELRPFEYNIQSKRMVKKLYGFDVFPVVDGSKAYVKLLDFFSRVRLNGPAQKTNQMRKGLVRITL